MSTSGAWLAAKVGETEHFIERSQVVEVIFRTDPAMMRDRRGGEREAETDEERANPDRPARFVARIITTRPGYDVEVSGDEARRLYEQIRCEGRRS